MRSVVRETRSERSSYTLRMLLKDLRQFGSDVPPRVVRNNVNSVRKTGECYTLESQAEKRSPELINTDTNKTEIDFKKENVVLLYIHDLRILKPLIVTFTLWLLVLDSTKLKITNAESY